MRLVFAGDIMLGRHVRAATQALGADHPFSGIADLLVSADLRMANLECVVMPELPPATATMKDRSTPVAAARAPTGPAAALTSDLVTSAALASGLVGRFDVLSLANNHILDHGNDAALATRAFCVDSGIAPVGFGATPAVARAPVVLERGGQTVGFLAYTEDFPILERRTHPGPAYMRERIMLADIAAARRQVDHVVVSLHADFEYVTVPAPWRVALSRRLVDAGARVVVGHHPHVPQGIERHGRGLIAYSVGNLVYDAPLRPAMLAESPLTARSIVVEVELDREGVTNHRVHALRIDDTCRPVPLHGAERDTLLAAIDAASAVLGDPQAVERAWRSTCRRKFQELLDGLRGLPSAASPDMIIRRLRYLCYGAQRHWVNSIVDELSAAMPPMPSVWSDDAAP